MDEKTKQEALEILRRDVYHGFGPTLAAEYLSSKHDIHVGRETVLNERMFGKQEPIKRGPDGQRLEDSQGSGASRRSFYLAQTRTRSVAFLHAFDCPDMTSENQS